MIHPLKIKFQKRPLLGAVFFSLLLSAACLIFFFGRDPDRRFEDYTEALFCQEVAGNTLSLVGTKSGHGIRVDFPGFDFVGVWAAPGAPFVALEPWTGTTTLDTEDDVLEHKHDITILEPGGVFERSFDITLL